MKNLILTFKVLLVLAVFSGTAIAQNCILPYVTSVGGTHYNSLRVHFQTTPGATQYRVKLNGSTTMTVLSSPAVFPASPCTNYSAQVQAYCNGGWTTYSTAVSGTTYTGAPTNLLATNITTTSAKLNWTYENGVSYFVRYKHASSGWTTITVTNPFPSNGPTITGLCPGGSYEFQVAVKCPSGGAGTYSASSYFNTTNCSLLTGLKVYDNMPTSLGLQWNASGTSSCTTYLIRYRRTIDPTWAGSFMTTNTYYQLTGLTPNTSYTFEVIGSCNFTSWTQGTATTANNACNQSNLESNQTLSTAISIPINTQMTAMLYNSLGTDVDYYKVSVTTAGQFLHIEAKNLPANANVSLLNASGLAYLADVCEDPATSTTTITLANASINTYYIKVSGTNAQSCYTVKAISSTYAIMCPVFRTVGVSESPSENDINTQQVVVYPNPLNGATLNFDIELNDNDKIELSIFDVNGKEVYRNEDKRQRTAGQQTLSFDTQIEQPGIYFYRLVTTATTYTGKLLKIVD